MPPLSDQVIAITGASAGIGAALALRLATQYPTVRLVLAARSADRLDRVADQCRQAGADVLVVPTDMADLEQVNRLAEKALSYFGRIDALVNNAGYGQVGPIELVAPESAERQFQVNVLGPMALSRALIPAMRTQGGGRIVNLSSVAGRLAFPLMGVYSASKFALEGFSDALRMELAPFDIAVSLVEPGPVKTEFFEVANRQADAAITQFTDSPYQAALAKLVDLESQIDSMAWSADRVAQVIIRALSDRTPKPRYTAATGAAFLWLMTKVFPTGWVDRFWQHYYGIDQVAKAWRSRQ